MTTTDRYSRGCAALMLSLGLATMLLRPVSAQQAALALPTFAALEAAGARVGEIRIRTQDVFDTADPKEDKLLFRWANALHVQTRPGVIERALLFKSGEPVSVRRLEETERLLRSNRYLYDVKFLPAAVHDGVVDIDVLTRDTWTLDAGVSAGRSGGENSSGLHIKEYNLFGTGTAVSFGHSTNVDRTSNEFAFSNDRAFGTWTSMAYSHASNSDGQKDAVAIVRPFYSLDTRWAAGVKASKDDRIDSVYNAGNIVSQYQHRQNLAEVFAGWSPGWSDGWVPRYSLGVSLLDDAYAQDPPRLATPQLPTDQKLVAPFLRYELIEDRFETERNRNLIGRPEYFALGFASTVQLGWASTALGSSHDAWLYSASLSKGFEPLKDHTLIASTRISGQYWEGAVHHQRLGAQAQYYLPQGRRWLFYASASADMLTGADLSDELQLGGDNGLRGYPLRYQSGTRRALFTAEERFYTDLYLWQLFRVGGAAFVDTGRAWDSTDASSANTVNPGWLSNVGFGLRIVSSRAAFSNVLHVDIALPVNTTPDMKKLQLLVKTKASF